MSSALSKSSSCDIAIIGAGILGVSVAFWLSELYNCSIFLIDKETSIAYHTSSRNTGIVHRPFYLDPIRKKIFARSAAKSYVLWASLAARFSLPWKQVGTLEVATNDQQLSTLDIYKKWSISNGMREDEADILDSSQVKNIEPEVECLGAIFSKTDTSVDYREFAKTVYEMALANQNLFPVWGYQVEKIEENENNIVITLAQHTQNGTTLKKLICRLLVNAAGGGSLDLAHMMELSKNFTDLHFRGEYWVVGDGFGSKVSRNVYSVAKFKEYPFLDPHFIVRASGKREIGPNAVLVSGPNAYKGLSANNSELIGKIFERPNLPKLKLFASRKFLSLAWHEWRSSISKDAMCSRVRQFIPSLRTEFLTEKGFAGVRSSLIGPDGKFVPEAIQVESNHSVHILNYNSPGATGAASFSACVIANMQRKGYLDEFNMIDKGQRKHAELWNFDFASEI